MKDPIGYSIFTYLWVTLLSVMGGIVSHVNQVSRGMKFSMFRFVADILTSAFVGVVTFYLCQAAELAEVLTAAFVAISGHMGSRLLFIVENKIKSRIESI